MSLTPMTDPKSYLTPEQVESIICCTRYLRDELLVRMLFRTGVRISELLNVQVEDVDCDDRVVMIKRLKTGGDTAVLRPVPIDRGTLTMVGEYVANRGNHSRWLFDGQNPGKHLGRAQAWKIVKDAAMTAGIRKIGSRGRNKHYVHPHTMRHSFAMHCVKGKMEIAELQKLLGHASPATTAVYLQYSAEDLHKGYDRIWDNGNEET